MDDITILKLFNATTTLWQQQNNVNEATLNVLIEHQEKLMTHNLQIYLILAAVFGLTVLVLIQHYRIKRLENDVKN